VVVVVVREDPLTRTQKLLHELARTRHTGFVAASVFSVRDSCRKKKRRKIAHILTLELVHELARTRRMCSAAGAVVRFINPKAVAADRLLGSYATDPQVLVFFSQFFFCGG
jgi:hypothetical protein